MEQKQTLAITIVQPDTIWMEKEGNFAHIEELLSFVEQTDFIVLPEMFNTGFCMDAKAVAEVHNLNTTRWMKQVAMQHQAYVAGSFAVKSGDSFYNRAYIVSPTGDIQTYDKQHLFSPAEENLHYEGGKQRVQLDIFGWKIDFQICYDLRFPETCRNAIASPFDVQVVMANWPAPRANAWHALLTARAIENAAYQIGCNRVGNDGNGFEYIGGSIAIDFKGNEIASLGNEVEILQTTLDKSALLQFREKFPVLQDILGSSVDAQCGQLKESPERTI